MIDPASIGAISGKVLLGKHIAESVVSGNDPSLMAASALAFPSVKTPPIPTPTQGGEHVVARKELGEMPSSNPNIKDQVVLEKFVDSKYVGSGNLEDAWASLSNGELTFDSFLLAMVDIVDALTLGVFKPQLLEIKINPHIKAREVVYRAEVAYDTPTEETVNSVADDGSQKQETIKTQRRITQVSKISFEISPEAFEKADISLAESIQKIKSADIADRTVVYARLDTLTEKDIRTLSSNGLSEIDISSQRLQSIETNRDLLSARKDSSLGETMPNDKIVEDKEIITTGIKKQASADVAPLSAAKLENTGVRVYNQPEVSAEQVKTTTAIQQESIDHLTKERSIKSGIREEIVTKYEVEVASQNLTWGREATRLREAVGEYDIFALKDISVDDFVSEGAKLLADKERISDTIVAVDISQSGETINLVNSSTKRSWLIKESDIRHEQATSTKKTTTRIARQVAEYDYLTNGKSILSANIETKEVTATTVEDIVETKTHWNLFGWNASGFLGENIKTEVTPVVTTHTYVDSVELVQGQDIFSNFNATTQTLVDKGGRLADHSSHVNTEHHAKITEHSFEEGKISYVPFVGGIGNLASKAGLGGEVTLTDAFWAAADVAEIATTIIAVVAAAPTGGVSIGAQVAATSAKTAAKVAAKTAAKSLAKATAKTAGEATIKGTLHIAGKNAAKLTAKTSARTLANQSAKQTGKLAIKQGGKAGAKAGVAKTGSIVRYKNIPKNNGVWKGVPGDSQWCPDPNRIPKKLNPQAKSMGEILADNKMSKGIPFKQGQIDLSKASRGTVKIDDFGLKRSKNFAQADQKLAEAIRTGKINPDVQSTLNKMGIDQTKITKGDIKRLRTQGYTWHERPDMKTLDLTKSELHANLPHSGGISVLKSQLAATNVRGIIN